MPDLVNAILKALNLAHAWDSLRHPMIWQEKIFLRRHSWWWVRLEPPTQNLLWVRT